MSDLTPDQILATLRVYNRFKPVRDTVELITDLQTQITALEAREEAHNEIWASTIYSIELAVQRQAALKQEESDED